MAYETGYEDGYYKGWGQGEFEPYPSHTDETLAEMSAHYDALLEASLAEVEAEAQEISREETLQGLVEQLRKALICSNPIIQMDDPEAEADQVMSIYRAQGVLRKPVLVLSLTSTIAAGYGLETAMFMALQEMKIEAREGNSNV